MCGKCWVLRVGCVEAGLRYGRDTDISDGLRSEAGHVSEIGHVSGIIWNLNQSELLQVPAKCGIKHREVRNQTPRRAESSLREAIAPWSPEALDLSKPSREA